MEGRKKNSLYFSNYFIPKVSMSKILLFII